MEWARETTGQLHTLSPKSPGFLERLTGRQRSTDRMQRKLWNPPQHAQLVFLIVLLLRLLDDGLERGIGGGFLAQSFFLRLGLALANHLHVLSDAFFLFLPSL